MTSQASGTATQGDTDYRCTTHAQGDATCTAALSPYGRVDKTTALAPWVVRSFIDNSVRLSCARTPVLFMTRGWSVAITMVAVNSVAKRTQPRQQP